MRRNRISLDTLQEEIINDNDLDLTKEESINASNIVVIKRDGREEPYSLKKMYKVVNWACSGDKHLANDLLRSTEIKLYEKIKITDVYTELVKTAANKISLLYPQWEFIAAKLYLLELYKDSWKISDGSYPDLKDVITKGVHHNIYNKDVFMSYSNDEIEILSDVINPKSDLLFNYKGLVTFNDKYCLNYSKTKKLELPQHVYMRIAMFLHHKETNKKIEKVIETYNYISNHDYTYGSPITMNSGTINSNLSSCVLSSVADDTISILDTNKNLGVYSKYKGGTALDVSRLRARGSYIMGNQGNSSGAVNFIKIIENTMKAFDQGGKRSGACAIYFQWWNMDFQNLIVLKSNGGTEDNRARGLKYSVKINQLLIDRFINDEDVSLFDPKSVPELFDTYGEEFNKKYIEYEKKSSIKRKVIKAREIFYLIMKERSETGNIYLFHEENVNTQNMLDRYINTSNLCSEITEPSTPSNLIEEELVVRENGEREIRKKYSAGEIALCNLASVNLYNYFYKTDEEKDKLIYNIMSVMDNTIDLAVYPVKEAMNANMLYRYLGIGVSNFTNLLASQKIVIDTQESLEFTSKLFDELSYRIISSSMRLAKERGAYPKFRDSKWARGELPVTLANKKALNLTEYKPDYEKWKALSKEIQSSGIRNALTMAIAPTACQTLDSCVMTKKGSQSLEKICSERGIDYETIQNNDLIGWYDFSKPLVVRNRFGLTVSTRIWYNGRRPTRTVVFDDNERYTFTLNHKLSLYMGEETISKLGHKNYNKIFNTLWKDVGDLNVGDKIYNPDDLSKYKEVIEIIENDDMRETWDIEVPDGNEYMLSNGCISHNTSGKSINATESILPVVNYLYKDEGTSNIIAIAPNFRENNKYYKKAFDCDQMKLVELAAVRQIYLDQSQSVDLYFARPDSFVELMKVHLYGFELGMKTFYYMQQNKSGSDEICESCT